jgi:SAM-dependent methyltransferase
MSKEQSKSAKRRFNDGKFHNQYFVGRGIDIGAGGDSLAQYLHVFRGIQKIDSWDKPQGDAQYMNGVRDNTYDFVHSSHCLEHMVDPHTALLSWINITKPGGHLIITVPEESLYERNKWPSRFNGDHKHSFTIHKSVTKLPCSISLLTLLSKYDNIHIKRLELIDDFFDPTNPADQTRSVTTECSIEIILQKHGL